MKISGPSLELPLSLVEEGWRDAVGFARVRGELCVAFPKVYDEVRHRLATEADWRTKQIVLLVRVLTKYVRSGTSEAYIASAGINAQPAMLDWLEAACELIDDYQKNGLYWIKRDKLSSQASTGPISWSATMRRLPVHIGRGVPFHLEVMRRTRARSSEDLLHRLHAYVIDEVSRLLIGKSDIGQGNPVTDVEASAIRASPKPVFMALARTTYTDRGKHLLALIQRYFQIAGNPSALLSDNALLLSSEAFELVWEHMLRATVQNAPLEFGRVPQGRWTSPAGIAGKGIAPRPDFTFSASGEQGPTLAIFDAKDKRIAVDGRTGTEQDHYKQIIYRLLGNHQSPVWNALLFPSMGRGAPGLPFTLLGSHVWNGYPTTLVHEIAVDYPTVCSAFLSKRHLNPTGILQSLDRA